VNHRACVALPIELLIDGQNDRGWLPSDSINQLTAVWQIAGR
jgi:hypothetical protein